jgi:hypothetical protein
MYEIHTTQAGTEIHPGQTFNLDYSLVTPLDSHGNARFEAGLAGYHQRQTTATHAPHDPQSAIEERYAVNAVGIAVSAALGKKVTLAFKGFKEFANRATFQGYSLQLIGAISF